MFFNLYLFIKRIPLERRLLSDSLFKMILLCNSLKVYDESMGDIDRVIEEIVNLMEQSEDEELGFNQEPVTSKLARN